MNKEDRIIVLRKVKYGEADLIIHGLNRTGGRINFLAKSALRSKKRFGGGVLEPTHYLQVMYKDRGGDDALHFLQDAKVLEDFSKLRTDIDRLDTALYFVKLMAKVTMDGEMDSHSNFNLLGNALKMAEDSTSLDDLRTQFEIKFLYYQGILPLESEYRPYLEAPLSEHINLGLAPKEEVLRKIHFELSQFLT